jgi:hypothetical protein
VTCTTIKRKVKEQLRVGWGHIDAEQYPFQGVTYIDNIDQMDQNEDAAKTQFLIQVPIYTVINQQDLPSQTNIERNITIIHHLD